MIKLDTDKVLTNEQFEKLISVISNPKHLVQVFLLRDAGLRVTEMCTLKWSDLDFTRKTIKVKSLKKRLSVNGSNSLRTIPISERLLKALSDMVKKKGRNQTGFIFVGLSDSKPITRVAINKMLKEYSELIPNFPHVYPHMLRHTFATDLRANGADMADIRDVLGHERMETSLIYAHQNNDSIRNKINQSAPKKSFFEKVKDLFSKKSKLYNFVTLNNAFIVGRDSEVKKIEVLAKKGISVIITGPIGVGKSHLLENLKFSKSVIELDDTKNFKNSLSNMLVHLYTEDKKASSMLALGTTEPESIQNKVSKESMINICKMIINCTDKNEYILKINDLDQITPSVVKCLETLKDHFIIIGTARNVKMDKTSFLWAFERIELNPLSRADSLRLFYKLTTNIQFEQIEFAQNKVFDTSEGNPRMIFELCERIAKEPIHDSNTVIEICDSYIGKKLRSIDLSPYLLFAFSMLIIYKYIGRESGEKGLTFIGSVIGVILIFGRFVFVRSRRTTL